MSARETKGMQTKKRILNTALQLFKDKSFNEVTVDEIIQATNTSKGAFYNHFKSKHDIFLEKFKEIDDYYVDEIVHVIEKEEKNIDKLKVFLKLQMAYIERDLGWDVIRTIYEVELNPDRESHFLLSDRPLYCILIKIFRNGQEVGEFRSDHTPEKMLDIFLKAMRGILYDWSIQKASFSLIVEHEHLFGTVIEGLKARPN